MVFRQLREKWEQVTDQLSDQQRRTEVSLNQLLTFEDGVDQFESWLKDVELRMNHGCELQATLSAKNVQLQNQKVSGTLKSKRTLCVLLFFCY